MIFTDDEHALAESYRYFGESFLIPELGEIDVAELRIQDFDDLYRAMAVANYDPSTVRKCHTLAGSALKYAERQEWVGRNVARLVELPKAKEPTRNVPDPEQLCSFLDISAERDPLMHDFCWIMANTGLRPGEACALMQSDLAADDTLTIQRSLDVSCSPPRLKGTKTNRVRRIVLDKETATVIRARGGPFVFGGEQPMRTDLASKRWKRLAAKAGLSFTPRACRHFHATQLVASGHPTKDVADRLGHSNSLITEKVYIQYIAASDAALSGSVAGILRGVRS